MGNVNVSTETLSRVAVYAQVTGKSIEQAVNGILHEWMDDMGDLVVTVVQQNRENVTKMMETKSGRSRKVTPISKSTRFAGNGSHLTPETDFRTERVV